MYLYRDEADDLKAEVIQNMTDDVLVKFDFVTELLKGDDWSLVIKAHSLIESVVTELIISKIKEEEMKEIIERLPLHGDLSKITIIKKYDLLSKEKVTFIKNLSELRNKLAHKFEHVNFTFNEYLKTLDKNKTKTWIKTQIWFAKDDKKSSWSDTARKNPQLAVFTSVLMFVTQTIVVIHELEAKTKLDKKAYETTKKLLSE